MDRCEDIVRSRHRRWNQYPSRINFAPALTPTRLLGEFSVGVGCDPVESAVVGRGIKMLVDLPIHTSTRTQPNNPLEDAPDDLGVGSGL